jgi:hypothetical protein
VVTGLGEAGRSVMAYHGLWLSSQPQRHSGITATWKSTAIPLALAEGSPRATRPSCVAVLNAGARRGAL